MTTATWSNRPDRLPLEVISGMGFDGQLVILNADGTPMDLTGATMTASIFRNPGPAPTTLFTPTVTIINAVAGQIRMVYSQPNGEALYGVREPLWSLLKDGDPLFDGPVVSEPLGTAGVTRFRTGQTTTVTAATTAGGGTGDLEAANNLSDLDDIPTARTNLGLGTAATTAASAYATAAQGATADTALQPADVGTAAAEDIDAFEYAKAVLGAVANAGAPLVGFDNFAAHPDGTIHAVTTIGHGTADPITWGDGLVGSPTSEPFLETCEIVSGVLRHRGTRLVAAASVLLPTVATRRTVSVAWADPTVGPGLVPFAGADPVGYASLRINFIDVDASLGDGYVAYVEQTSDTSNHTIRIVRDDNQNPTLIAGPVDLGRRLNDGEVLTFGYFDNTYFAMAGGTEVLRVTDTDHDPATFDSTGIVLNTQGNWLPGCYWWSMSDGVPAVVDSNTNDAAVTSIANMLTGIGIQAAAFNEPNGFEIIGRWDNAATMGLAPGEIYASRHQGLPRTWSQIGLCVTTASGTPGDVLLQAIVTPGPTGVLDNVVWEGSHDANTAVASGTYIAEEVTFPWEFWHVVYAPSTNTGTPQVWGGLPRTGGPATWSANGINRAGSVSNTATTGATLPDLSGYVFDDTSPTSNRLRIDTTSMVPVFGGRG